METVKAIEEDVISLPDPRLDPSRTNIVRARKISIVGRVVSNGQHLALYGDEVSFSPLGSIDTSGRPPVKDFTNLPRIDGAAPGEGGKDGEDASPGDDGGHVRIYARRVLGSLRINTSGGNGGKGRDGGKGQKGEKGTDCRWPEGILGEDSNPGAPGKPGGNGGTAGRSGHGGNAGGVDVKIIDPHILAHYTDRLQKNDEVKADKGKGGAATLGGEGGDGGDGGAGGPYQRFPTTRPGVSPRAASGSNGTSKANGSQAPDGEAAPISISGLTLDRFAAFTTATHMNMLVSSGEAAYRNSRFPEASEIFGYVYSISKIKGAKNDIQP